MSFSKSIRIVLVMISVFSFSLPAKAFAHGAHFHSLQELEQHIAQHVKELDQLMDQNAPQSVIDEECAEITVHAMQYKEYAFLMQKQRGQAELGKLIEKASEKLQVSAGLRQGKESLEILREMKNLVQPNA